MRRESASAAVSRVQDARFAKGVAGKADADRQPAPRSESQEPRQSPALPAPRQGGDPRGDQGLAQVPQGRRGRGRREGHDPVEEPARPPLARRPASATTCCPATRSTRSATRSRNPGGGRGSQGSPDGEGQDECTFTKEEFLDLFFDDLKLPNLVNLKDLKAPKLARAGYPATPPPQPHPHHAQEPGPRAAAERGRDRSCKRSLPPPRPRTPPMRRRWRSCASGSSTSSGCAAPSPTSIRSILPTTGSSGCRSPPPRR